MVQFSRLRLSGFKSFVDKTELDIGSGLNGIVGPNGCGKSNLVEALRWVMGENRAKHMRGDGMEDVIFAGTSQRPARNIAEVSLLLDNSEGTAPLPFGNTTEIEVTRRIERGKGSKYLVNGKEVRARDVHVLLADSMTGAHSPALVSQGRVTQLIGAKPAERRQMLEESAGVAALYTRRKEAESRLNAAEDNLQKLDLVIGEMQARANSLRGQAKQALRYTDLSDAIHRLDMVLAWQGWINTRECLRREEAKFANTDKGVQEAMLEVSRLTREVEGAVLASEDSRKADIETRASLQLLKQSSEALAREEQHRADEYADLAKQIEHNRQDASAAFEQHGAQRVRIEAIREELAEILASAEAEAQGSAALEAHFEDASQASRAAEEAVLVLQDAIRRSKAELDMAARESQRATSEMQRIEQEFLRLQTEAEALQAPSDEESRLLESRNNLSVARAEKEAFEQSLQEAQERLELTREAYQAAQALHNQTEQALNLAKREAKSVADLLVHLSAGHEDSLLLSLDVPADIAPALTRAMGEMAAGASADSQGSAHWAGSEFVFSQNDWPLGVSPFNSLIEAPACLQAALSAIGLLAEGQDGQALSLQLKAGQILVSRAGHIWRWDGLVSAPEKANSRETQILELRQQVRAAEKTLLTLASEAEAAKTAVAPALEARNNAQNSVSEKQALLREASASVQRFEADIRRLEDVVAARIVKRDVCQGRLVDAKARLDGALLADKQAKGAYEALEAAQNEDEALLQLNTAEERLASARAIRDTASAKLEAARASAAQAVQLQSNLARELERTQSQMERANVHMDTLKERLVALESRYNALTPLIEADLAGKAKQDLLERIAAAEEKARTASDAYAVYEQGLRGLQASLKAAEQNNINNREKRAVIQATVQALQNDQARITSEIQERFGISPSHLENTVMTQWPDGVPSLNKARDEREMLNREREAMGPVNLRAQAELEEMTQQFTQLENEKAELAEAISRLREGITMLNSEARTRIVKTFEDVSAHFQTLFKQLFGGGEAQLKMTDSHDPLEAGLEIFAQPPGKSLQSLSLLSGGEQTLTALAMIFAMFLSNPAPVCVLDEVDAPLDDANVDRVCSLLEDMSKRCATRFLVITHHRMTMARMQRLYGVTMAERGVSKLVSVNLAMQGELLSQSSTSVA